MDLFEYMRSTNMEKEAPLAARMRPRTLDEVVGQEHIIGKDKLLYRAIKADKISSIIFYGPPGTGKTTFLEKLIPKLKAYGLKIAIVKHDGHRFDIDYEGKDSDRFTKAGADVTGLISSEKAVLMDNRTVDPEEFLKKIDGVDLILTEGFKHGPWPKIMLHRKENGKPMPLRPEECLAVISDVDVEDCENVFPLDDVGKTAVFLLQYIQQNMQHIENL